ncbi:MAG: hypothetical protein NVSMB64_30820 [Candidatus Velthaea sp.]
MSLAIRQEVEHAVRIQNRIAAGDLLSAAITQTDLIALLARAVLPPEDGGLGYKLLLTAIRSDHGDDSALGPHSHAAGYAVDCWPQDESQLEEFIEDMALKNRWVVKIGLGGSSRRLLTTLDFGDAIVFEDNDSDHVHLSTT